MSGTSGYAIMWPDGNETDEVAKYIVSGIHTRDSVMARLQRRGYSEAAFPDFYYSAY